MAEKRILVLGAHGMAGHMLLAGLRAAGHDCWGTVRDALPAPSQPSADPQLVGGVDAMAPGSLADLLDALRPAVVVNAIGIIKQRPEAQDPVVAITVNALFPQILANLCRARTLRLIHLSTDCVFSGTAGGYDEDSPAAPPDLYGRSKLLGEVDGPGCLTLRTSIIGPGLRPGPGLVDWLLAQRGGRVTGYAKALFSGLTTVDLCALIARLISDFPRLDGLYHAAAAPISKYDLLHLLNDALALDLTILRDESVVVDRSLSAARLSAATGWSAPPWPIMVSHLAAHIAATAPAKTAEGSPPP